MPNRKIGHGRLVVLIWSIADNVLRDLYVRGKYRDVNLPFTVLRRLDSVLKTNQDAVFAIKNALDQAGILDQDAALRDAAKQGFYNTSGFRLKDLRNATQLCQNFEFRNQLPRLVTDDKAYENAQENNDPANARVQSDRSFGDVMLRLIADDTQFFKEFQDNESFKLAGRRRIQYNVQKERVNAGPAWEFALVGLTLQGSSSRRIK